MHCQLALLPALCLLVLCSAVPAGAATQLPGIRTPSGNIKCLTLLGRDPVQPSTQHPNYVTLAYGRTRRIGSFTCASRRTGLTCRNGRGHRVFLSRESWRAW